ncbi:MAG: cyclic nucleotide-binding domain-containing protein [Mariprofundaceae bacterium]|nr:cyclic nucleotide-binding domain-containing protein [Mariprofundaceae bacterium]
MIWDEEIETELAGLGEISRYAAGTWLPDTVNKQPVIRHILSGHVDIHAIKLSHPILIARYGPGEILGIRSNIYPVNQPQSRCRAFSDIECREISWQAVETLSSSNSRLESMMQHIAQVRTYGAAIAIHPGFSCLNLDERRSLFDHSIVRLLAPGEKLICKSELRAHMYLLISGSVDIISDGISIAKRSKGEILGEISLLGFSKAPTADVIAESFSEIIEFRDTDILAAIQENPVFKQRITALIDSRTLA